MGTTEFAAGEWCGVELDEPRGKNDGSVGGKRLKKFPSTIVIWLLKFSYVGTLNAFQTMVCLHPLRK